MDRIKVVIFDLDGVLVDATEWHYTALNRALALFGFSITRYEHVVAYNGLPTKKKLEMLSVEKGLPVGLHGLINRIKQVYTREEIFTKCKPSFQKQYMLSRLRREGLRLAVCSNAIRDSVVMMLQQSGIDEYFEFVIGNEEVHKAKPDPEIYLHAFKRLECNPTEVVIVEDAPHGVEAAKRSGAWVCKVNGFPDVEYFMLRRFMDRCSPVREVVCLE